jgi:hypothetical protein
MEERQKYRSCQHAKEQLPSATVELETSKIVEVETREKKRKRAAEEETPQKKQKNNSRNAKASKEKNDKIFMLGGKEYNTYSAMVDV